MDTNSRSTNSVDDKPTVGFQDRYNTDSEFKRQVDDGRKRAAQKQSLKALQDALAMPSQRKKHY